MVNRCIDLRERERGRGAAAGARAANWTGPTAGLALGYVQANLVVVPRDLAFDFLLFCQRNPKPCPLLDVTEPGSPEPRWSAPRRRPAHRRAALPRLPHTANWSTSRPTCALGGATTWSASCSAARSRSRSALLQAGVPVRHIEQGCNVPMYRTNIACRPAGVVPRADGRVDAADDAGPGGRRRRAVCARFPRAHGTPDPLRRPGGDRHPRPRPAGLRRSGGDSAGRDAGVLGVRRDAAGGGDGGPAAAAA